MFVSLLPTCVAHMRALLLASQSLASEHRQW